MARLPRLGLCGGFDARLVDCIIARNIIGHFRDADLSRWPPAAATDPDRSRRTSQLGYRRSGSGFDFQSASDLKYARLCDGTPSVFPQNERAGARTGDLLSAGSPHCSTNLLFLQGHALRRRRPLPGRFFFGGPNRGAFVGIRLRKRAPENGGKWSKIALNQCSQFNINGPPRGSARGS